jgi:ATP-dependent DNA ligase
MSSFIPMGLHDYEKMGERIKFPAYLQPKLDGYRALIKCFDKNISIISRQGKPFAHLNFMESELKKVCKSGIILDGELLSPKVPVRDMRSLLGKKDINEVDEKLLHSLRFNIFDMFDTSKPNLTYKQRFNQITQYAKKSQYIVLTPTDVVKNEKQLQQDIEIFRKQGFEGGIIRNMDGIYKQKSSSFDVQKIKFYYSDKFEIVGATEGTGNDKGTVIWIVKCLNSAGTFKARPTGTREERRTYFENCKKYIGKKITIKYFEKDDKGCVMRMKRAEF